MTGPSLSFLSLDFRGSPHEERLSSAPMRPSLYITPLLKPWITAGMLQVSGVITASAHGTHSSLMTLIDRRIAENPEDGKLWYQRALLEFEHEDWSGTWSDLEKVEQYAPGEFPTAWIKGQLLDIGGKPTEAKSMLDGFLAASPKHWGALASRARVEMKLGMTAESLDDFRAALANHRDAQPDLVQEVAQALAANGHADEAVCVLEAGLSRLGPIPSLELRILKTEADSGRFDAALARLDKIQREALRPEPWMEKRASLLAEAGRMNESRAVWKSLIQHLNGLPASERSSHAMTLAAERAYQAITIIDWTARTAGISELTRFQEHR